MTRETSWDRVKFKVYAIILIAVCLILISLSLAMYNQSFKDFRRVNLLADRAGLQMFEGNRIKIDGVDAGITGKIENLDDGSGVRIELKLFPDMIEKIPANTEVSLEQLTAFGNKAVQMQRPANPSKEHLKEGDTLDARGNAVEINNLLQSLADVLEVVEPAKLNTMLGNIAQGLEGNGNSLGQTVSAAAEYLRRFNSDGNLDNLRETFRVGSEFSELYADITPDLVETLGNATTTLSTLTEKQGGISYLLSELTELGQSGGDFVRVTRPEALASTIPTTDLLGEYAPGLTCFVQGADILDSQVWPAYAPGRVRIAIAVGPTQEPYQYPQDLPVVTLDPEEKGPKCYGMPLVSPGEDHLSDIAPEPNSMATAQRNINELGYQVGPPLVVQLFGNPLLGTQIPPYSENGGGN